MPGDVSAFTIDESNEKRFSYYENAKNYLKDNAEYDFQLYNVDDAHCSEYVLVYKKSTNSQAASATATIGIFDKYSIIVNADEEVTYSVSYYAISSGKLTSVETTAEVNLYKTVSGSTEAVNWSALKKGDLLRLSINEDKIIDAIEYMTSLNTDTPTYGTLIAKGEQEGYIQQFRVTRGRVYSKNGTLYSIYKGSDIQGLDSLDNENRFKSLEAQIIPGNVYIFDREDESFEKGKATDVTDYLSTRDPDAHVVVYQYYGSPESIIVVK